MTFTRHQYSPLGAFYWTPLRAFGPGAPSAPPVPDFSGTADVVSVTADFAKGVRCQNCTDFSGAAPGVTTYYTVLRMDTSTFPPEITLDAAGEAVFRSCTFVGATSGAEIIPAVFCPDACCGDWLSGAKHTQGAGTPHPGQTNYDYYPRLEELALDAFTNLDYRTTDAALAFVDTETVYGFLP